MITKLFLIISLEFAELSLELESQWKLPLQ